MKWTACLGFFAALTVGPAPAQETPAMPVPKPEHEWLKKLEGEWVTTTEAVMEPGKPPMKYEGTESTRTLGGFWSVSEMKGDVSGDSMVGILSVGYDSATKKYVGTFVGSGCEQMFRYEGTLDGQTLTLNTEGPNWTTGKTVKMRDVLTIVDKDHKTLTSSMLGDDGKWVTFMTAKSTRKK